MNFRREVFADRNLRLVQSNSCGSNAIGKCESARFQAASAGCPEVEFEQPLLGVEDSLRLALPRTIQLQPKQIGREHGQRHALLGILYRLRGGRCCAR